MVNCIPETARIFFTLLVDKVFSFTPRKRSNSLLLVRVDAIGDFILWLDAAKELRKLYPERQIVLLANSVWADLAKELPFWDEVLPVDINRFMQTASYRWDFIRTIRRRGFDTAVQPTYSRVLMTGDSLIRASGARVRIGSSGDNSNILPAWKKIADRWYTRLLPTDSLQMMELERNAEFLRNLCLPDFEARVSRLPALRRLRAELRIDRPYFIVFPGSSWIGKQWPSGNFSELIDRTQAVSGWLPVLCGGKGEHALCTLIASRCNQPIRNLAGITSLAEFSEVVRNSRLMIANDTSAIHMAAAVNTPSVCILGGGHFGRFLPYPEEISPTIPIAVHLDMTCFGCNWVCTQPHTKGGAMPCISGISVDAVFSAVCLSLGLIQQAAEVCAAAGDQERND